MTKFNLGQDPGRPRESDRGSSSIAGTEQLRSQLIQLFGNYSIHSVFDAGCNDCVWSFLIAAQIKYSGGDINPFLINNAKKQYPDLDVHCLDIRKDSLPLADCMMVRDVTIHLDNHDKKQVLENFKKTGYPWLLITHVMSTQENLDLPDTMSIVATDTNWCLAPWNWPQPTFFINEYQPGGRCLALWHRDQIQDLI
jgi:SAM-dependent methyltransferase